MTAIPPGLLAEVDQHHTAWRDSVDTHVQATVELLTSTAGMDVSDAVLTTLTAQALDRWIKQGRIEPWQIASTYATALVRLARAAVPPP